MREVFCRCHGKEGLHSMDQYTFSNVNEKRFFEVWLDFRPKSYIQMSLLSKTL